MPREIILGGVGRDDLCGSLEQALRVSNPNVIGIASAFVSVQGVAEVIRIFKSSHISKCHFVAGIDNAVTHPEALAIAKDKGWEVRVGKGNSGLFHPKLIVAGKRFNRQGVVLQPSFVYVGSGNLTNGGLKRNVECNLISANKDIAKEAATAFGIIWKQSSILGDRGLKNYSAIFAEKNRLRKLQEIEALGVSDQVKSEKIPLKEIRRESSPERGAFSNNYAEMVWTELKSFTGEYSFQVEFPRLAGEILNKFIGSNTLPNNKVEVLCENDTIEKMTFRYYEDNSMYRLNIPRRVPGVEKARNEKQGIALVRRGPAGGVPISLAILPPGAEMDEIIGHSYALGTWGKTTTRLFGWS